MKLEELLEQQGIEYEKHQHAKAYTAQELAHAEHVTGYMVAKPVIVKGKDGYAMCVVSAPKHVDLKRVGEVLNDPSVKLADESELAALFPDAELGAEPPVGPLFNLQTIMDTQLQEDEHLVMQAGMHTESIKLRRSDWERLCQPIKAPISAG